METTHVNLLATFRRLPDAPKLCRSELLGCDILFDTGSALDIIPTSLLEPLRAKGCIAEDVDDLRTATFADGTSRIFDRCLRLTLPLSESLWVRSVFCVDDSIPTSRPRLLIGRRLLKRYVVQYTREAIHLLDACPEAYSSHVPLEEDDGLYYVRLAVNGREQRCYLDTGHADALTLPMSESVYATSPVHEIEDYLTLGGKASKVIDREEERGLVEIGGLTRHGPIIYADYYRQPCWFNPALIFAEFAIDLGHRCLCFKEK